MSGDDLASANAALQTVSQGLRVVSPLAGATIFTVFGGRWLAVLDVATFAGAIASLLSIGVTESEAPPVAAGSFLRDLGAGFRHAGSIGAGLVAAALLRRAGAARGADLRAGAARTAHDGKVPVAVLVINRSLPRAGDRLHRLCAGHAAKAGWELEFRHLTTHADRAADLAASAVRAGADLVIAAGGDGTVRGCAQGVTGSGVPLAIVPLGTANLIARALRLPAGPGSALDAAFAGKDAVIDLADADGLPFAAMAGIGLDAEVVGATRFKHRFGWLAYAMAGAACLARPPATFTVRIDGGEPLVRRARSVVVGNTGLLPGGFTLLPDAVVDDGLLDVGILAPSGPLGWARVAGRVLAHSHRRDHELEWFTAQRVEIAADGPLPREADGEILDPGRSLTVTIRPGALLVRVPCG